MIGPHAVVYIILGGLFCLGLAVALHGLVRLDNELMKDKDNFEDEREREE